MEYTTQPDDVTDARTQSSRLYFTCAQPGILNETHKEELNHGEQRVGVQHPCGG
jgi:hypothetical protein